jgi:hypothetical protein
MVGWLKKFNLQSWWIAAIPIGIIISGAALAAKEQGIILVGIGVVTLGCGKWMNLRLETENERGRTLAKIERKTSSLGPLLDSIGIISLACGLYFALTR